ncbi:MULTISPECIES: metallophosphoesterase [unclassified Pseudomonas]|uniref:metallophosphoesterase family protein n=1 Tax=unclassified Pseudomonas TaxID=196821 RepID=UPI000B830C69|nr:MULTISPECIES: metallophosphoesterase family protein [unclassified Pseudomonas]
MRIAAISDIHGNVWALEAVLDDIRRQGVDLILNLGDILSGPLEPAETADILMAMDGVHIKGNHERQLLDCAQTPGGHSDYFAFLHTTDRHHNWLRSLPSIVSPVQDVLMFHGTPQSDTTCLLEYWNGGALVRADGAYVDRHLHGKSYNLYLCGHSHIPRVLALGNSLVVNPGSVGLQAYTEGPPYDYSVQTGSPHARYCLLEKRNSGWVAQHRLVEYRVDAAVATARSNGRDDWALWLQTGQVTKSASC